MLETYKGFSLKWVGYTWQLSINGVWLASSHDYTQLQAMVDEGLFNG